MIERKDAQNFKKSLFVNITTLTLLQMLEKRDINIHKFYKIHNFEKRKKLFSSFFNFNFKNDCLKFNKS